jgi:Druantia protein DruA
VEHVLSLQGRVIGAAQLQQLRQLLTRHPEWSRYRLSRELCSLWDWRAPNGQIKDMAARTLLLKLEQRGHVCLPPKRRASPNRMLHKKLRVVAHAREPIRDPLVQLTPVEVIELSQRPQELPLYEWLLHEHHYLSYASPVGLNLKYLVRDRQGRPLSCLLFGSAAWKCAPRDQFIGWSPEARQGHLQQVTNNTRFLILPWVQVRHLASHVLGQVLRRLPRDWRDKYARPLDLVETFVDSSRFTGACYGAANWLELGQTTGRTRQDRDRRLQAPPKRVWVYPLVPEFRRRLCT